MSTLRYLVETFVSWKAIGQTSIFFPTITKVSSLYSWPVMTVLKFYEALLVNPFYLCVLQKGKYYTVH